MIIPKYSENPPSVAPIKLAPKLDEGELLKRKVVEKIRPAKKTGRGTAKIVHKKRIVHECESISAFGTRITASALSNSGKYQVSENRWRFCASALAAKTIARIAAVINVMTSQVAPK